MINQYRINTGPKVQEPPTSQTVASPNKFQRTNRRGLKSPRESNVNAENIQHVVEPLAHQQPVQRSKIIQRTKKTARQLIKSPRNQQFQNTKVEKLTNPTSINPSTIETPARSRVSDIRIDSRVVSNYSQVRDQTSPASSTIAPINSSRLRTKTEQKIRETHAATLKKTSVIGFIINRLLKKSAKEGFWKLQQHKLLARRKNISEAKCLLLSSCQLAKRYESTIYQFVMQRLKNLCKTSLKQQHDKSSSFSTSNSVKAKHSITHIMNFIQRQRLRESFDRLRMKKNQIDQGISALSLLSNYETKKMKQCFSSLKLTSSTSTLKKKGLLQTVANFYNFCIKEQLRRGFHAIEYSSLKRKSQQEEASRSRASSRKTSVVQRTIKTETPLVSPRQSAKEIQLHGKIQKLKSQNSKLNGNFNDQQQALQEKKALKQQNIRGFKSRIEQLKESKEQMQKDVKEKKATHQAIKSKVSVKIKTPSSDDFNEAEDSLRADQKLRSLQKVYSDFYRMSEEQINDNIGKILKQNQIEQGQQSEILEEWSYIVQKAKLQKEIDLYESSILGHKSPSYDTNSVLRTVRQQNEMVGNMIKNFVKERYLWGEVQKFVSAVL